MRINDVNLGGGLYRLDVEPTMCGENIHSIPTHAMDDIMRDVVRRLKNGETSTPTRTAKSHTYTRQRDEFGRFVSTRPTAPCGEPDGIDAHIDRPKRENYGGWDAQWGYENDLRKYREAEKAIKACTWPCREPMKGAPTCGCTAPKPTPKPKATKKQTAKVAIDAHELLCALVAAVLA